MQYTHTFTGYAYLFLVFSNWSILAIQQDQGIYFKFISGKFLLFKELFYSSKLMSYSSDRNGCVSYCLTNPTCKSANFRNSTGECSLFGLNSWENEFNIVSDNDGIIIQKIKEPVVTHGEWTMVFRGVANIGKSVFDAFTKTSLSHDLPLSPLYPIGCLRLDTNISCDHHFRSKLLNNWEQLNITEVKFSLFKDGVLKKFLLFNGSSSTSLSWFSPANLINSSWSDLSSSLAAYFSVRGFDLVGCLRRFYIQSSHTDCPTDNGWVACIDQLYDYCPWGRPVPTFPRFLYSSTNTKAYNKEMMLADVMAIFIKF